MKQNLWTVLILCAATLAVTAQQPQVTNTQFKSEPASSGLAATVNRFLQPKQTLWLGYEVAVLPRTHLSTCSGRTYSSRVEDGCCGEYQLEEANNNINTTASTGSSNQNVYILLRLDDGVIQKVRTAIAGCRLNAGGAPFEWLTEVQPDDSAEFLGALAARNAEGPVHPVAEEAMAALSLHATPKATIILAGLASPEKNPQLREKAAFWLGAQRGHGGLLALRQLERQEQDSKLREKLAFDFSINSDPASIDELIHLAKSDPAAEVRGQALFWLSQKAGNKATATLTDAVNNDPEFGVKKKAVFALSQLPKDESIPQLIHVADTNADRSIRKEAIFWLGQSNDPRALQYLIEVLKR